MATLGDFFTPPIEIKKEASPKVDSPATSKRKNSRRRSKKKVMDSVPPNTSTENVDPINNAQALLPNPKTFRKSLNKKQNWVFRENNSFPFVNSYLFPNEKMEILVIDPSLMNWRSACQRICTDLILHHGYNRMDFIGLGKFVLKLVRILTGDHTITVSRGGESITYTISDFLATNDTVAYHYTDMIEFTPQQHWITVCEWLNGHFVSAISGMIAN